MKNADKLGVGRKAIHLNYQEDGIRLRAVAFRNKKAYNRTAEKRAWKNA